MSEFTQGICQDGAAILRDGVPMTIEEILEGLRANDLALKVADASSASLIESHCLMAAPILGAGWWDMRLNDADDEPHLFEALEYLELRGLLERHPSNEGLVRVIEQEDEQG